MTIKRENIISFYPSDEVRKFIEECAKEQEWSLNHVVTKMIDVFYAEHLNLQNKNVPNASGDELPSSPGAEDR